MSGKSLAGSKPRTDREAPTTDNDGDSDDLPPVRFRTALELFQEQTTTARAEVAASEAVASAREACYALSRDGPAPRVEDVLREMGRGPDGYEIPHGPDEFVPAQEAARRALDREGSR